MLLTNRFAFFNKKGDNLNPQKRYATYVSIIDDAQFPGIGAIINAYTNFSGQVIYIEILDGGTNYGPNTYIEIRSIDNDNIVFTIPNSNITFDSNGSFQSIIIPNSINNNDFPTPSTDYIIDYSLERVSTDLISVDQIYILENIFDSNGKSTYTFPRIENYGPFNINSFSANGSSAKIEIESFTFTGLVREYDANVVARIPAATIANLVVGMNISGTGIPENTFIFDINTSSQSITLTNPIPGTSLGEINFTAYFPHDLQAGSKIFIDGGALDGGPYVLTKVDTFNLYFDTSLTVGTTPGAGITYQVVPKFKAYVEGDDSFFLFDVNYNEDYPTITKSASLEFEFTQAASSDTIPSSPIGGPANNQLYQRTVYENIQKTPLTINIGHQSNVEGVFITIFRILDITFASNPGLLMYGVYRAETEAEDERLGILLSNIGRDVDLEQELILRDSDVDESNVDYILLNQKRREMLLQGDQIWPYVGSYKGLVNIINWFGYYDIRLKEYFLNVNSLDTEFGTYRQVPIAFQLKDKKQSGESLNLVPSKHYKKTSMFGLFYDLVKDSGNFDENGIPITTDAFEFTNEEALIKFFALKKYLKEKFLPLNSQITDITGEGVYYERYAINSWRNVDERRVLELTRPINFTCEDRAIIQDLRPYTSDAYLSPTLEKTLQSFMNRYDILDISITSPGGPYTSIPNVTFPGTSNQQATGYVKMKGYTGSYSLANPAGTDFIVGDIITLNGGTYESPLRLIVSGVTGLGVVTDVIIQEGSLQGSGYSSFPQAFGQSLVVSPVGTQYEVVNRSGFTAAPSDLGFEVEDVWFLNKGLGYSTYPVANFTPNLGTVTELNLKIYDGTPVGNINNGTRTPAWNDAPNIPVGAVASLSTEFPITWDEVPYTWYELGGSTNANVIVHVDPLPNGTGEVIAAEIINPGTEYKFTPTLKVVSQEGANATLSASLRKGQLNLLEYTVVSVGSTGGGTNNVFNVSPEIAPAGSFNVTSNRLVTGDNISNIVLTSNVTVGLGTSTITVENYDLTPASTTVQSGDKIFVHQGVEVTNAGTGYISTPEVNVNSGHTRSIFTWNDLGRGEFYQMQWKVVLSEPEKPTNQFNYDSGVQPIDLLIDHTVVLPYVGKYTVELIVYNTDNNFANLIKKNCIEVYMAESDFSYIAKFLNGCVNTWDSLKQLPNTQQNQTQQEIENNRYIDFNWDNSTGRWINPIFNNSIWESFDFRWDNLDISDISDINNYSFPYCEEFPIVEISPEDNLEGPVIGYQDSTTNPPAVNPTIIVQGQRLYPPIDPLYNPDDEWIFIRRDETVYQLNVLGSDYSNPEYTYIELFSEPPEAFKASPATWEVLREIGGTITLNGNKIYNEDTNPSGISVGKFIKAVQRNNSPIRKRIPINGKNTYSGQPSNIILNGEGNDLSLLKKGEIGKIYKVRDGEPLNGDLNWNPIISSSAWVIESVNSNIPEKRDHLGKIYIKKSAVTCNPLDEIRPGFTQIKLYAYLDNELKYTQDFRTTHVYLDTSNVGSIYDIWSESEIYVIDIAGINGGPIDELNSYLINLAAEGIENVYLEYEYQEFPTRIYYGENVGGAANIYFDFNMYPSSGDFNNAPSSEFDSTAIANHTNWYFDNGILYGDFSLQVTQIGNWKNGVGTILSVSDQENDLLKISSSFQVCQRNFDEDSAERKLGSNIITWQNYKDVIWQESCALSWNTLDFSNSYWCNFIINDLVQNSGLTFNEDDTYNFTGIVGGMSTAQIYAQALYELNNLTSQGLNKFYYYPISEQYVSPIFININTYSDPNSFFTSSAINVGDVIYGEPFEKVSTVLGITGTTVTLDKDIKKKATFIGDCIVGDYKIKNVAGLLENQIAPGDILTSDYLPLYPTAPATVTNIFVQQGVIREITLSSPFTGSGNSLSFYAEWNTGVISTQVLSGDIAANFKIIAQAKTPSVDCLGYLTGEGGLTFEAPDGNISSLSHSFPVGNYYSWLGFGENKVGSFLTGLNDFVINYRNIQTYLFEGLSPFGYKGWYPASDLPSTYSYISSPYFSNSSLAESDSQRLPYERSIGGALTWEETWANNKNGKFPIGVSILFTSDTSKISGKSKYLWKIKENEETLVETSDSKIMWTFTYPGIFGVELLIEDTNGNSATIKKNTFIEIDENFGSQTN